MERNAYDMISNGSILPGNIFWRGGGGGERAEGDGGTRSDFKHIQS